MDNDSSIEEAIQGYEVELENDSASQLLSVPTKGRGDGSSAHSASSTPTRSLHVHPTVYSKYACVLCGDISSSASIRSLPSLSQYLPILQKRFNQAPYCTAQPRRRKRSTNNTALIEDIG